MAFFVSAASVGGLLSSAGSGFLLSTLDGLLGARGWRWLLAVEGIPTILLGMLAPLLLEEHPKDAKWLSVEERRLLLAALESDERRRARSAAASTDECEEMMADRPAISSSPADVDSPLPPASAASSTSASTPGGGVVATPPPIRPPLMRILRATIRRTPCLFFCYQYIVSAAIANSARFFLPTLLKEVFPSMAPWRLGLIFFLPSTLKVVLSPPLAAWADAGGQRRRFKTSSGLYALAATLLVLAGLGMLISRGGDGGGSHSAAPIFASLLIALISAADVLCQLSIPIFWSLYHAVQPASLQGISIAVVNSIGNGVGGFLGPWFLGAAHDAMMNSGSACINGKLHARSFGGICLYQWGWGTVGLGAATLAATAACAKALSPSIHGKGSTPLIKRRAPGGDVGSHMRTV